MGKKTKSSKKSNAGNNSGGNKSSSSSTTATHHHHHQHQSSSVVNSLQMVLEKKNDEDLNNLCESIKTCSVKEKQQIAKELLSNDTIIKLIYERLLVHSKEGGGDGDGVYRLLYEWALSDLVEMRLFVLSFVPATLVRLLLSNTAAAVAVGAVNVTAEADAGAQAFLTALAAAGASDNVERGPAPSVSQPSIYHNSSEAGLDFGGGGGGGGGGAGGTTAAETTASFSGTADFECTHVQRLAVRATEQFVAHAPFLPVSVRTAFCVLVEDVLCTGHQYVRQFTNTENGGPLDRTRVPMLLVAAPSSSSSSSSATRVYPPVPLLQQFVTGIQLSLFSTNVQIQEVARRALSALHAHATYDLEPAILTSTNALKRKVNSDEE